MQRLIAACLVLATLTLSSCVDPDQTKTDRSAPPLLPSSRKIVFFSEHNDNSALKKDLLRALRAVSSNVTTMDYPPTGATAKVVVVESLLTTPLTFDASVCGAADRVAHGAVIRKVGGLVDGATKVMLPAPNFSTAPIPQDSSPCGEPSQ